MNETKPVALRATHGRPETERNRVTAEVISCPGQLCDDAYSALQINIEGFESPYVLTLTLRAVGYKALSEQGDPFAVCQAIAAAVNDARIAVELKNGMRKRAAATSVSGPPTRKPPDSTIPVQDLDELVHRSDHAGDLSLPLP